MSGRTVRPGLFGIWGDGLPRHGSLAPFTAVPRNMRSTAAMMATPPYGYDTIAATEQ